MSKNVTNLNKQAANMNLNTENNHSHLYSHPQNFKLVSGESLVKLDLAYETYGKINPQKDNVILVHHSLSMSAKASLWWEGMIGENKAFDTNKYFIICINNLGSCFGSTGPGNYPEENFPLITIHDMVISQKLLLEHLGISKLKLITGGSMGGMLALAWLQLYPDTVENLFIAAASARAYPVNIFNRMIQQEIIKANLHNPQQTLKIARMLGYFYYRSNDELNNRFSNIALEVEKKQPSAMTMDYMNGVYKNTELYNYFSYNSEKFIKQFDYKSYLCLLNAMDLYDLTVEKSYHAAGFARPKQDIKVTIAGISTDILFPLEQQIEIYHLLKQSGFSPKFIEHESTYGHDAFLVEYDKFGGYITELLNS